MDWQIRLIVLYIFISEQFQNDLWITCQRFTNNNKPEFTDEEVLAVFLYGIMQKRSEIKDIYNFTANHLGDWFPHLPSYVAFVQRLNRLSGVFPVLTERILGCYSGNDLLPNVRLIDSFPVVMANARRSSHARVASEVAGKGYCSSKKLWYYGVKVHVLGIERNGSIPLAEFVKFSPASDHDLDALRNIAPSLNDSQLFADMAYIDEPLKERLKEQNVDIQTPVKRKKGQEFLNYFDRLFSTSVSKVRQPIESLFNWVQEKTNIQIASKVRSFNGLMVHIFGRMAAAMFIMVFDS
jgi:hypothetical protein